MSLLRNLLGAFMPHPEARRSTAAGLAVNGAELVHDVNGDESATIFLNAPATLNATYNIQGTINGFDYFDILAYPYTPGCTGGTVPVAAQPMVSEVVTTVVQRALSVAVGGLAKIRVRLTAYTSGTLAVAVNTDACAPLNPFTLDQKAATLILTNTGAAGAAVTVTLPSAPGLRHYIDAITIVRSATVLLTAAAVPLVITTTNLPGGLAFTMGADAAAVGADKIISADFGSVGLAAVAANAATTVVAPVATGSIWRLTVAYRLDL